MQNFTFPAMLEQNALTVAKMKILFLEFATKKSLFQLCYSFSSHKSCKSLQRAKKLIANSEPINQRSYIFGQEQGTEYSNIKLVE